MTIEDDKPLTYTPKKKRVPEPASTVLVQIPPTVRGLHAALDADPALLDNDQARRRRFAPKFTGRGMQWSHTGPKAQPGFATKIVSKVNPIVSFVSRDE